MITTTCNLTDTSQVSHCCWNQTTFVIAKSVVANLPVPIVSPAFRGSIRDDSACMIIPSCNLNDTSQVNHCYWKISINFSVVANLPVRILSPAFHCPIRDESAAMLVPNCNLRDTRQVMHCYWNIFSYWNIWPTCNTIFMVANSPVKIVSPAFRGSIRDESAGMVKTSCNLRDIRQVRHCYWNNISTICNVVANLPVPIKSPAFRGSIRDESAVMISPSCNLRDTRQVRHCCWNISTLCSAVAKLPVPTISPAFRGSIRDDSAGMITTTGNTSSPTTS
jgi:hypothetical protein